MTAPLLHTGDRVLRPGWVRVLDGLVADVGEGHPPTAPDHRLATGLLAPGLIDAQVNGGFGVDLASTDDAGWRDLALRLPAHGVTGFVPTAITAPLPHLGAVVRRHAALRPALERLPGAARSLGVHLEGPFLAPDRRGAHPAAALREPTPDAVAELLDAAGSHRPLLLTLAPELPGALAAIRTLVAAGIRVAVGHSDATAELVHAAADAGASLVTHLFNAQRPLHHRDPGVVGAALADPRLGCGLIVDGHHVAPDPVRLAFAAAAGRILMVSDAVAATGAPPGRSLLGGEAIEVSPGGPPRRPDGTLAGGACWLDAAIGRAVAAGVPLVRAVEAATAVPARALGRPELGRIAVGGPADLVWLDPVAEGAAVEVRCTWIDGAVAYGTPGAGGRWEGADRAT